MKRWAFFVCMAAWAAGLAALRLAFPERPVDLVGPRAILDSLFALGLLIFVLAVTAGAGRAILRVLRVDGMTQLEQAAVSSALGLGLLATGNSLLAFSGTFTRTGLLVWLGVLALLAGIEGRDLPERTGVSYAALRHWWARRSPGERLGMLVALLLLAACVLMALVPTWDYDGLMYHLQAPRLLLEVRQLGLMPDLWQANGPLNVEMIFALGLSLGSDAFAKLTHVWFGVLLILATSALGGRVLGRDHAWLSGLLMLGVPTLSFWAGAAYTDVAWAAFETLCLVGLFAWLEHRSSAWLILSGLLAGLALGTKPLAWLLIPIVSLVILIDRGRALRTRVWALGTFLVPAFLVGAPWYLKNLILAGNPIYPHIFGGPGWPSNRLALLTAYLGSFGMGRMPLDYVLLPARIFLRPDAFGTFTRSLDFPNLLFLLSPLSPQVWRSRLPRILGVLVLARFALWSLGSQQTRFLLPIFPCLAVLTAGAIHGLTMRWSGSRWLSRVPIAVVLAWLVLILGFAASFLNLLRFQEVVIGVESKDGFLGRLAGDYRAVDFIQRKVPVDARVLFMWDGRGYYCDHRCLPDAEQSRWTWYVQRGVDAEGTAGLLRADGIGYIFHSHGDAQFILEHDPSGANRLAEEFFLREFRRRCTRLLSSDPATEVYELTCLGDG